MAEGLVAHESEASVLGSMLLDSECVPLVVSKIKSEDFSDAGHFGVMQAFESILDEGHTPDMAAIIQILKLVKQFETLGGEDFIKGLIDAVDSLKAIDTHCAIIKDCSDRRISIAKFEEATEQLTDMSIDASDIWSGVYDTGLEVSSFSRQGALHVETGHPERGLYKVRMQILKDRETAEVLFTGWDELDSVIPTGWAKQDLSICSARPGMGKSSWRGCVTRRFCDRGYGVALCSTEQTKETETDRNDALLTGIPISDILKSASWEAGDKRLDLIKNANRYMDENWKYDMLFSRDMDVARLREWLTLVTRTRKLDILFIDLFDRFKDVGVSINKPAVVTAKLGELAQLAQQFNIHICVIVQVNRSVEKRADRRPRLSDLKDAGGYEELGRLVMLLYRDAYYNEDSLDNTLEVCIAKQNQGPAGPHVIVPFTFNPETLESIPQSGGFFGAADPAE